MTVSVADRPISVAPEWAPQKAIWTAWPAHLSQWNGNLEAPRRDVAAMVRALAPANLVRLLVNGAEAEASARAALGDLAEIVPARYGDIWLRDTGPIFASLRGGAVALKFKTNSWGGKFDLPDAAQSQPQRLEQGRGRGGAGARARCQDGDLDRRGAEERSHRRSYRQHRPLRGPRARGVPVAFRP